MNRQSDIGKKVNETLESLEGIQRAEAAPYFFTRVKARLERDEKNIWETIGSLLARPAVAVAGLCVILAMNAFILFTKDTATPSATITIQNAQLPVEEYMITVASNSYDYENLEQ
jgi:hypothetical protein